MSDEDEDTHSLRQGIDRSLQNYRDKLRNSSNRRSETAAAHAKIVIIAERIITALNNKWRDEKLILTIASAPSGDSFETMSNISVTLQGKQLVDCLRICMKSPEKVVMMESHEAGSDETPLSAEADDETVELLILRFVKKSIDFAREAI